MSLLIHFLLHLSLSLLTASFIFYFFRREKLIFIFAILSGVFVDADHFFDHLLAFGLKVNLVLFVRGYHFLKSDKIYILFHAWEYVLIGLILSFLVFKKKEKLSFALLAIALSLFFHLIADSYTNKLPFKSYSLIYRIKNSFNLEKLVTKKHWQDHLENKQLLK